MEWKNFLLMIPFWSTLSLQRESLSIDDVLFFVEKFHLNISPETLNLVFGRSSHPVFWKYAAEKITGEHPCRSVISKQLQSNFIKITLPHGYCSPVNLLHIFRTTFKNTSGRLLLFRTISWFSTAQWLWYPRFSLAECLYYG